MHVLIISIAIRLYMKGNLKTGKKNQLKKALSMKVYFALLISCQFNNIKVKI